MRWRDRIALIAALGLAVAAAPDVRAEDDPIGERIAVVDKTEAVLVDKSAGRAAELRARVRALYKLSRAGAAPLWIDGEQRSATLRRRGAAQRILLRDLRELEILRDELSSVAAARSRLETAQSLAADVSRPAPRSLTRPVPGALASTFGEYRGRRSKTQLTSRGIKLASTAGESVRAPHAGRVEYAGALRGLDQVVVIARDDGVRSVVGLLGAPVVALGDELAAGDELAKAAGTRVYLEVRIDLGAGGLPVDPAPLLSR